MKKILPLFLLILFNYFHAQEYIFGKVTSEQNIELSGVLVINTRTDEKVYSDSDGNFMIAAKNNDNLRFVRQRFDRVTYNLKQEDFKNTLKITLITVSYTHLDVYKRQKETTLSILLLVILIISPPYFPFQRA